jgi:hypothetical protein
LRLAGTGSGNYLSAIINSAILTPVSLENIFAGTLVGADRFVKAINNLWIL